MKKNILIYIGFLLFLVILSIGVFIFIDIFKPSEHAALKAYNNGDYYKARTIYTKLYKNETDYSKQLFLIKSIANCFEASGNLKRADKTLFNFYNEQTKKKDIANYIIQFYSRNNMLENYKIFKSRLIMDKGNRWVDKHIDVMSPKAITITSDIRTDFSKQIFKACFPRYFGYTSSTVKEKDSNNKIIVSIINALLENKKLNYNDFILGIQDVKYKKNQPLYKNPNYSKISVFNVQKQLNMIFDDSDIDLVSDYIYNKSTKKSLPDFFVYKNNVYYKKNLIPSANISFPDVDAIIDNLDETFTVTGNLYSLNNISEEMFKYIFEELSNEFPEFNDWEHKENFGVSFRFNIILKRYKAKESGYVYKVKEINVS